MEIYPGYFDTLPQLDIGEALHALESTSLLASDAVKDSPRLNEVARAEDTFSSGLLEPGLLKDLEQAKHIVGYAIADLAELLAKLDRRAREIPDKLQVGALWLRRCRIHKFVLGNSEITIPIFVGPTVEEFEKSVENAKWHVCAFPNGAFMHDAKFSRPLIWTGNYFAGLYCHGVEFKNATCLDRIVVAEEGRFKGCWFRGLATFSGAEFERADFSGSTFFAESRFDKAHFQIDARFSATTFRGTAYFQGATFDGRCHLGEPTYPAYERTQLGRVIQQVFLRPAVFTPQGRLHLGESRSEFTKFKDPHSGEAAYRTGTQHAQSGGDRLLAGDYYYLERVHRWRWRSKLVGTRRWREYVLARCVFGYGEKPYRLIITAGVLILACAFGYLFFGTRGPIGGNSVTVHRVFFSFDPIQFWPTVKDFFRSVYFSAITMATVGYGDVEPLTWRSKALAALEGLTGVVLAALLAVSIAKRYSRG